MTFFCRSGGSREAANAAPAAHRHDRRRVRAFRRSYMRTSPATAAPLHDVFL